ncbi:DUF1317 family protein [Dickeya zeae]|uniref:DUF1317 family protein n=1 Tax=Dickeya zeae TaxID=204042 RepID=UPI000399FAD3|nr:DUF1317 family protein [Dickeya zeae]
MKTSRDSIIVGKVEIVYSTSKNGWITPGGQIIRNPLKAQRIAENLNGKQVMA